jgi:branched-chain amino acid transport system substrate-binding protein
VCGGDADQSAAANASQIATNCKDDAEGLKGEFVFGAVLPLLGPVGSVGQGALVGLEGQACLINQNGGILGRKVVIESRDSAGDRQQAVSAMRDLLASGKVNAVFPDMIGPITAAVLP